MKDDLDYQNYLTEKEYRRHGSELIEQEKREFVLQYAKDNGLNIDNLSFHHAFLLCEKHYFNRLDGKND